MRTNMVKRRLRQGDTVIGTMMFEFNTTGVARAAAFAGAEFAVYDMEHTGWSVETIRMLVATTRCTDMVPIVRVPQTEYHFIARVLDMGALGVMVPMVESQDQARTIVSSAKYPPMGRRGAAFGVAHDDYTGVDIPETVRSANEESLLIAQIETARGLECVEMIASVSEIDVLWIGLYDLANSLGLPGQFQHPDILAATDRVLKACRDFGKTPAVLATSIADGQTQLAKGFRLIAYGADVSLYQLALREGIATLRK